MQRQPIYTQHAREQMADLERGVSEAEVERVLASYDLARVDAKGNLRLSGEVSNGRRVLIVVARGSDPPRIISVWPTGKRRRV